MLGQGAHSDHRGSRSRARPGPLPCSRQLARGRRPRWWWRVSRVSGRQPFWRPLSGWPQAVGAGRALADALAADPYALRRPGPNRSRRRPGQAARAGPSARRGCERWWHGVAGSPPPTRPPNRRSRRPSPLTPTRPTRSRPRARISYTAPACAAAVNESRRGSSCAPFTTHSRRWTLRPGCFVLPTNLPPLGPSPPTTADRAAHLSRDASSAARGQAHVKQGDRRGLVPQPEDGRHHLSSVYRNRGFRSRAELAVSFKAVSTRGEKLIP